MPSTYAHYRFGKQLLPELPHEVRQSIQRFRRLYDMGLHGPDLFFYHKTFFPTAVGDLGHSFHTQSGQNFFTHACTQADSEAARVYLFGVLGHYALDSACHPFVEKMAATGQAGHVKLESEFERYLMEIDGMLPSSSWDMSKHVKLTGGECVTVASFYPPAKPGNVYWAHKAMVCSIRFLNQKNRARTEKLLTLVKKDNLDNLIPLEPTPGFARMDSELLARYNRALRAYPRLLEQILDHMKSGTPLGEDFAPCFDPPVGKSAISAEGLRGRRTTSAFSPPAGPSGRKIT